MEIYFTYKITIKTLIPDTVA